MLPPMSLTRFSMTQLSRSHHAEANVVPSSRPEAGVVALFLLTPEPVPVLVPIAETRLRSGRVPLGVHRARYMPTSWTFQPVRSRSISTRFLQRIPHPAPFRSPVTIRPCRTALAFEPSNTGAAVRASWTLWRKPMPGNLSIAFRIGGSDLANWVLEGWSSRLSAPDESYLSHEGPGPSRARRRFPFRRSDAVAKPPRRASVRSGPAPAARTGRARASSIFPPRRPRLVPPEGATARGEPLF